MVRAYDGSAVYVEADPDNASGVVSGGLMSGNEEDLEDGGKEVASSAARAVFPGTTRSCASEPLGSHLCGCVGCYWRVLLV